MTVSPPVTARRIEPDESLEPGEYLLGGVTSAYLERGRGPGYGLYFTNQRIIGVRRRRAGSIIFIVGLVGISTYLVSILLLHLNPLLDLPATLLLAVLDPASRYLTRTVGDRVLAKSDLDIGRQLKKKKDFETWRVEISRVNIGPISKKRWRVDITFKDYAKKEVSIKINGKGQYGMLRNLVVAFSNVKPAVALFEF